MALLIGQWAILTKTSSFFCPGRIVNAAVENGYTQPLLTSSEGKQDNEDDDGDEDCDDAEEDSEEIQKPVNSIASAYRLLTPSVKVWCLFLYFFW